MESLLPTPRGRGRPDEGSTIPQGPALGLQGPHQPYRWDLLVRVVVEMILLLEPPPMPPLMPPPTPNPKPEPKPLPRPNPPLMAPELAPPPTTAAGERQGTQSVIPMAPAPKSPAHTGRKQPMAELGATYRCSRYSGILQTFCVGENKKHEPVSPEPHFISHMHPTQ